MTRDDGERSEHHWMSRPVAAGLAELAASLIPAVLGLVTGIVLGLVLPASRVGLPAPIWIPILTIVTVPIILFSWQRVRPRLLAYALLLKMDGFFLETPPARYGALLYSGNSATAALRLDSEPAPSVGHYVIELISDLTHHDRRTRGHAERVRAYTHLIAEHLEMSPEDASRAAWGGLLHDVGKLAVPAELLQASRPLTDTEFETVKEHSAAGALMMEPLTEWLGDAVHAARDHHRNADGSGYPDGIDDEITLEGRIVAVADAFDVMTARRVYQKPISATEALAELHRCSGTQFDPVVVAAMTALHDSGRAEGGPIWSSISNSLGQALSSERAGLAAAAAALAAVVVGGIAVAGALDAQPDGDEVLSSVVHQVPDLNGRGDAASGNTASGVVATLTPTPTTTPTAASTGSGTAGSGGGGLGGSDGGGSGNDGTDASDDGEGDRDDSGSDANNDADDAAGEDESGEAGDGDLSDADASDQLVDTDDSDDTATDDTATDGDGDGDGGGGVSDAESQNDAGTEPEDDDDSGGSDDRDDRDADDNDDSDDSDDRDDRDADDNDDSDDSDDSGDSGDSDDTEADRTATPTAEPTPTSVPNNRQTEVALGPRQTATPIPTATATATPTPTATSTATPTQTATPTTVPTATPIPTASPVPSATPTATLAPTATAAATPTATAVPAPTATATPLPVAAPTATATPLPAPTATATATATPLPAPTATPTATATPANQPPTATDVWFEADRNTIYTIHLSAFSSDPDGDPVTWTIGASADPDFSFSLSGSEVTLILDRRTPIGTETSIEYTISDGTETATATISLQVVS